MKMKQVKFIKLAVAMLCCMFAMTVASCDKDDDETPSAFKFNPAKVEVAVGESANVTVNGGTEPYTVASSDVKIATVTVSKNTITVTGVKEGKVTLNVSDKNKKVGMIAVTVKKASALELDKKAVNVAVGKEETITVKNGTAPYTATAKDVSIATVSVKDGKITVKGVKAGTTTITVTDKNKLNGTISVTVK